MPLTVTWIAPKVKGYPDLAWLNELARIQKISNVVITTRTGDNVVLDDVAALLSTPADVMAWSGHGTEGGLLLSDGVTLVKPRWLAMQVAFGTRPRVAVLAACGSQGRDPGLRSLTEIMCRAGVDVIGFPAEADDAAAGTFTVELIRGLALNSKVADAFDVAMESIAANATSRGVFLTPGMRDIAFNLEAILATMQASIDALAVQQAGDEPLPAPPIANRTAIRQPVVGGERRVAAPMPGHIRGLAQGNIVGIEETGPVPPTPTETPNPPTPVAPVVAVASEGGKSAETPA